MNKAVDSILISSNGVDTSINSSSMTNHSSNNLLNGSCNGSLQDPFGTENEQNTPNPSPNLSPKSSPCFINKKDLKDQNGQSQEITRRFSDSTEIAKHASSEGKKERNERRKKKSWYSSILYPTYKSRSSDFRKIFKVVPNTETLIVDYSCALQREILVHGRLYVSQNYLCFYANIFTWETHVIIRWKDVTSMTKEKTALVIPNAISVVTASERFFFTSFGSRDKTYMMLFKIWQNVLMGQIGKNEWKQKLKNKELKVESISKSEMRQLVYDCYGEDLGLTSDDGDVRDDPCPSNASNDKKSPTRLSIDSCSEVDEKIENPTSSSAQAESLSSQSSPVHSATGIKADGSNDATDLGDYSESEEDEPPCPRPSTAICSASHNGRLLIDVTLPIQVDQLFTLLFTNSKFFLDFHNSRKNTDLVQSTWSEDTVTGQKVRTVSLTMSLSQLVGPKSSQVTEFQSMLPCSSPGHLYCIDIEANNAGIPYADSFSILSHYCLSSISKNVSSFAVYSEIKYRKNVWGLVKNFIEKNCWTGMQDYFDCLVKALALESEEAATNITSSKRKTRRKKHITSTGVTLQTRSPDHSSYDHQPSPAIDVSHARNINVPELKADNNVILSWILLAAVLCLLIVNGLLYYKLYSLEETATYKMMDPLILENLPKTEEDWINLLQQQESSHSVEIKKWQRVLHTAAQLLRQTEESLTQLQMSIHPSPTEKIFSALKPGLKAYSPHGEQSRKSDL